MRLDPGLILIGLQASSAKEVIDILASRMHDLGYVKETFAEAVWKREQVYSTGLPTEIPVGLPHTDIAHCLKPAIAIAILKNPVEFGMMGDPTQTVQTQLVFCLSVTVPDDQVIYLRRLIDFFQQTEKVKQLITSESVEIVVSIMEANLADETAPTPDTGGIQVSETGEFSVEHTITNEVGLHARPAAKFVQACSKFKSKLTICNLSTGSPIVDAKSIIKVLSLAVRKDNQIRLTAAGEDAEDALVALSNLIRSGFDE